ncbi:MAG: HAD-IIA family hydrolase [Acidimicrobiales bacterium]
MVWVLDLDGVVWLGGHPIAGAPEAVACLREAGHQVVFMTNNSGPTVAGHVKALTDAGIPARADELVTSAQAAASLLRPGSTAAVVGEAGIHEALDARGVAVVDATSHPDAVVVGRSVDLDYASLAAAATALRQGARFVAANDDATFPSPVGLLPGAGAVVAFLATASGVEPDVAGKPGAGAAELVRARFGDVAVVVGDRPDTDGRFARLIGARFALVLSGVTTSADLPVDPVPDTVSADLARVVADLVPG